MSVGKASGTSITSFVFIFATLFLASCGPNKDESKPNRSWAIATVFFAIALVGASAAQLIPAFAGIDRTAPPRTNLGPIVWAGLLGLGMRKQKSPVQGLRYPGMTVALSGPWPT